MCFMESVLVPSNSTIRQVFPFQNKPKYLDPSYKMDLDFRIVLEGR